MQKFVLVVDKLYSMPYYYFFCFSHAAPHSSAEDIHLVLANQKWFKQYMRERELTLESGYNIWTAMTKDDGSGKLYDNACFNIYRKYTGL